MPHLWLVYRCGHRYTAAKFRITSTDSIVAVLMKVLARGRHELLSMMGSIRIRCHLAAKLCVILFMYVVSMADVVFIVATGWSAM